MTIAWFEEQDRMTPAELETVTFPLTRMGRRGYEEDPVRDFLSAVRDEWVHLINDRASLWEEVQRLRQRIRASATNGDQEGVLFGAADAHANAVRILSAAQLTADRYVADAQAYSSRVTEEARLRRDQILYEAQQHSDIILEDAHAKASEAAVSALDLPESPMTDRDWQAAQAELAYLRTYSDVYRAHLRAYTESILRGIEEWEQKETASALEATNGHSHHQGIGR